MANKKRILVFIDWYLPGFKAGGPIRSCANLVAHLTNDFDFFIVTSDTDYTSKTPYESVKKNEWNAMPDGSSVFYLSKRNLTSSYIKKLIKETEVDYYYLNGIFSRLFTIVPLKNISDRKKIIVAVRGMLAPSAISIKPLKKKLFFSWAKLTGMFSGITFQASSVDEKLQIEKIFPKNKVIVAPNLPRRTKSHEPSKINKHPGELRMLSIARIAPEKNLLFALNILKNVKSKVVFDFFGPVYDNPYWQKCEEAIKSLPSNIKANYKGIAEADQIFPLIHNYQFLFMPSQGENFGHIILEALSAGLPVIISDKTPWKNLANKNAGWDISLNNSLEFIRIIENCVQMNSSDYQMLSRAASLYASGFIENQESVDANKRLFS